MLVLFLVVLGVFLSLCAWQVGRAFDKEAIITMAQQKALLPSTLISPKSLLVSQNDQSWERYLYRKNKIQGTWLTKYNYLHDNITYDGIAGYEVLTPFRVVDGSVILINRGWIDKRQYDEQQILLSPDREDATQTIEGIWVLPTTRFILKETPYPLNFPKIIQHIKPEIIAKDIQHSLFPLQLRLESNQQGSSLAHHWVPVYGSPQKHYAYALQWFFFALILCFLYFKMNLQKNEHSTNLS